MAGVRFAPSMASSGAAMLDAIRGNSASIGQAVDLSAYPDYESMSQAELWKHMDDPANVFQFVDYHQKLKNAEAAAAGGPSLASVDDDADLDDSYVSGLNCNLYDDDNEYPSPQCIKGDALTCSTAVAESYYYNLTCYSACHDDGGGWGVPCGWEAMKNMPDMCDDRETGPNNFIPEFPGTSKNNAPDMVRQQNYYVEDVGKWYWACNIHAFCYTCVDDTDTVDDYCKATVLHEKSLYAPSAVFDDLDDYWCEDTVLDKIADGTYCGWAKGQEGHKCV